MRHAFILMCALSFGTGSMLMARAADEASCPACDAAASAPASAPAPAKMLLLDVAASAPATTQAAIDVGNTKCIVMPDDDVTAGKTLTYKGKIYHFCCDDCPKDFLKNPDKYIKALEADPAKYGITKK